MTAPSQAELELRLDSFDPSERREALQALKAMALRGEIALPAARPEVNLHFHTFFSFNSLGWSPARIAWEARKYGLEVAGKVDFDVLEGMEEFLESGDALGQKAVSGLETRVFIREYAGDVINSPGEPGIAYFMAAGCWRRPEPGSPAEATLGALYTTARERTEELMGRVNDYLADVQLDYTGDVLPLTPAGNATERHLLAAYDAKAREVFPDGADLADFWARKLRLDPDTAAALVQEPVKLQETIRARLMKLGGVAYVQPDSGSFPAVEDVIALARDTEALPCATWLDGTNPGEDDMGAMLDLLESKGVVAANIIPDRNWNIKDADEKSLKLRKLDEMVKACRERHMPICVGTEMNKLGLPFVDDFSAPELKPYVQDFLDGAHFFWGHTLLSRGAGYGYWNPIVQDAFGKARARLNKFYTLVGRLPIPSAGTLEALRGAEWGPEEVLAFLSEKAR